MIRLRSGLASICIFALFSVAASAAPPPASSASSKDPRKTSVPVPAGKAALTEPGPGTTPPTPEGDSWLLLQVAGSGSLAGGGVVSQGSPSPPSTATDQHVYILNGEAGITASPIPETLKEDLVPSLADPGGISISIEDGADSVYIVSQEIADGIEASEAAGSLTPEIAAIAEPLDGVASSYASSLSSECATHQQTVRKVLDLAGRSFGDSYNLGGGFTGSYAVSGNIEGAVTAELNFDVKRKKVIAWCVPYAAKFNNVHIFGDATANAGVTLSGTVAYQHSFGPTEFAKPHLFDVLFFVGPVPVYIGFNLPVSAGLDLSAEATGSLTYNGSQIATGTFDWVCTLSDCQGGGSYDSNAANTTQTITGSVSGHVKPSPYVDVGFRAYLYDEFIAYAQVGLRPHLLGDLWGYTGNNCGDANGDGTFETVRALTFDLDGRIDLTGEASAFGAGPWRRTLKTGSALHIGFYDLIGSSAMQPELQGPSTATVGSSGEYLMKIRPCWPYDKKITYQLNWGDGSPVQTFESDPAAYVRATHTWNAAGSPTITATSLRDSHGRELNQSTSRTIPVTAIIPLALTVTPSPASATYGNAITWTASSTGGDRATVKYALNRRRAGTTAWIPAVTAWQTSNVLSWTPAAADTGTWEISVWVKDGNTPAGANGSGYADSKNPGTVLVVAPLTIPCTASQPTVIYGNPINWSVSATGGTPGTIQYALTRQKVGTSTWLPNPLVWQTSTAFSWTPAAADVGTWQVSILVRDVNTPANPGYTASCNLGQVTVAAPGTLSVTPSPASASYGAAITWTATASNTSTTTRYALFRRRAGTTPWTPDVTAPAWQTSNVLSWTPTSADTGTWEFNVWVKDGNTPAGMNTYGYAAAANPGTVQVVIPPLTLAVTPSPASSVYGNSINWTATAGGGTPATIRYALFRRRAGTTPWTPAVTAPAWQTGNVLSWTPTSADLGTWEIAVWVKDGNTPAGMNTYGYAAAANPGQVQVITGVPQAYPAKGWVDGYNSQHIWGWACDPDYPTQSNRVDVYNTSGQNLGSANASYSSSAAVNSECRGGTAHYFDFYPSGGIAPGTHFNVWSIDLPYATPGNDNRKLGGTGAIGDGTEFVIPSPPGPSQVYPPKGWVDGYNSQHIWGWACDPDYPTQSNRVDVYKTNWQAIGSANASYGSVAAINSECRGGTAHYFDFYPSGGIPSGTHFNVWSIDLPYATAGNDNRKLGGTGAIGDGTEFVIP